MEVTGIMGTKPDWGTGMPEKKQWLLRIIKVCLAVSAVWFVWFSYNLYKEKLKTELLLQNSEIKLSEDIEGNFIWHENRQYERDPSIKAFLIIGADTSGAMEQRVTSDGGQADGLFLAAYNAARGSVKILMIPRDTMTPITLTDLSGNILGKDIHHIALAYAYGDGRELSCDRTAQAVSELLCGLDIDGYLAMNTTVISELNDLVGGVTVHIETDGMERRDPALTKGAKVILNGRQAEIFVRYRDIAIDNSALDRMSQQRQYIEGFFKALQKKASKDDQLIVRLMDIVEEQMITNLSKDQYLNIGKAVLSGDGTFGQDDILTIPGEGVVTEFFDEYHYDPEGVRQMVLHLFYREL